MFTFRKSFALLVVFCSILATNAQAQGSSAEHIRALENRVHRLEGVIEQVSQRLSALDGQRPTYSEQRSEISCMLIDSGYDIPFIGKGSTPLEAEADLLKNCSKDVDSSFCYSDIKCDNQEPVAREAMCVLISTIHKKTFKAEGKSLLQAEYNARKACTQELRNSYCKGSIRCEYK